jgi:hypothetical protein
VICSAFYSEYEQLLYYQAAEPSIPHAAAAAAAAAASASLLKHSGCMPACPRMLQVMTTWSTTMHDSSDRKVKSQYLLARMTVA